LCLAVETKKTEKEFLIMFSFGWIDAHCHLSDKRLNIKKEIADANESGITGFISTALCQEEYNWHSLHNITQMKWCAGIHPYYEKSSEKDFDSLIKLCDDNKIVAIGEIGLDKRKDNFEWQKKILLKQLDLAHNYNLPVIFHIVKQYYELYKILKDNFNSINGFLHSFNSSGDVAELFFQLGLGFSLSANFPKIDVINKIIKYGFYFFETDAPYQKFYNSKEEYNHLKNLIRTVDSISMKTKINKKILMKRQYNNLKNLFN